MRADSSTYRLILGAPFRSHFRSKWSAGHRRQLAPRPVGPRPGWVSADASPLSGPATFRGGVVWQSRGAAAARARGRRGKLRGRGPWTIPGACSGQDLPRQGVRTKRGALRRCDPMLGEPNVCAVAFGLFRAALASQGAATAALVR